MSGSVLLLLVLSAGVLAGLLLLWRRERHRAAQLEAQLTDLRHRFGEQQVVGERLRDFTEAGNDWMWETDGDHIIRYASARLAEALAMPLDQLIGQHRDLLLAAMRRDVAKTELESCVAGTRPFRDIIITLRGMNGQSDRKVRVSGLPRFDAGGHFQGYRGTATDVTAMVRATDEAATTRNILLRAIEASPAAFCLFDADDRLIAWNTRYAGYFASSMPLKAGLTFEELVRHRANLDQLPASETWIQDRLRRHRNPGAPFEMQGADGRSYLIEEIRSEDGGTISVFSDISVLKTTEAALRASEARYRSLTATSTAGILHLRQDGEILFANAAMAGMLGSADAWQLIGRSLSSLAPTDLWSRLKDRFAQATGDEPVQFEVDLHVADHIPRSLMMSVVPFPETQPGAVASYLFTAVDISERKQAERDLSVAKDQAELANRAKSEFLANISHELRTPLNAIIGFSEVIIGEFFGSIGNERYKSYISDIGNSGRHLLGIINDLLDISKIEAGKFDLHPEPIDLPSLIDGVVRLIAPRAAEQRLHFHKDVVNPSPPLIADARAVRQILLNLLSNAVKFTPAGGSVTILTDVGEVGWCRLVVVDTGIGIASADIDKVLTPFGQADSALNRRHQGTGLGLPLSRALTELHGGLFALDSQPGRGTRVTVRLPLRPTRPLTLD